MVRGSLKLDLLLRTHEADKTYKDDIWYKMTDYFSIDTKVDCPVWIVIGMNARWQCTKQLTLFAVWKRCCQLCTRAIHSWFMKKAGKRNCYNLCYLWIMIRIQPTDIQSANLTLNVLRSAPEVAVKSSGAQWTIMLLYFKAKYLHSSLSLADPNIMLVAKEHHQTGTLSFHHNSIRKRTRVEKCTVSRKRFLSTKATDYSNLFV